MADLRQEYRERRDRVLLPVAKQLRDFIETCISGCEHVDRVVARAKDIERFMTKSEKRDDDGRLKYAHPLVQIQDQIGARIIVYYLDDVEKIEQVLRENIRHIEAKDLVPESESEFGYVGRHFIMPIPPDAVPAGIDTGAVPTFFELQIKTLFQHSWAEANHDLAYKCKRPLTSEEKRLFAYTAAQAWGADRIFEQLRHGISTPQPATGAAS